MNALTDSINQIEEALEAAAGHLSGPMNADRRGLALLCEQAQEHISALRALATDAERYRYLRAHWEDWTGNTWGGTDKEIASKLDADLDLAAMSAHSPQADAGREEK